MSLPSSPSQGHSLSLLLPLYRPSFDTEKGTDMSLDMGLALPPELHLSCISHRSASSPSLAPSLPRSLAASLPRCLAPSLPRCLAPSLPRSLAPSLPRSLARFLAPSLPPFSLVPSLRSSLPRSLAPLPPSPATEEDAQQAGAERLEGRERVNASPTPTPTPSLLPFEADSPAVIRSFNMSAPGRSRPTWLTVDDACNPSRRRMPCRRFPPFVLPSPPRAAFSPPSDSDPGETTTAAQENSGGPAGAVSARDSCAMQSRPG